MFGKSIKTFKEITSAEYSLGLLNFRKKQIGIKNIIVY